MNFEKQKQREKKKSDNELLKEAVREYLQNHRSGDFEIGSDAFVRVVIQRAWGKIRFNNLSSQEYQIAKSKIKRMIEEIKEEEWERKWAKALFGAKKLQEDELKRSGGIDPNEI